MYVYIQRDCYKYDLVKTIMNQLTQWMGIAVSRLDLSYLIKDDKDLNFCSSLPILHFEFRKINRNTDNRGNVSK